MSLFQFVFKFSRKILGVNTLMRLVYHCDIPRKTKFLGRLSENSNAHSMKKW